MRSCRFIVSVVFAAMWSAAAIAQQVEPSKAPKMPQFGSKAQELLLTKITVSDLVKSYDFYTKVIGLKLVTSTDYPLEKAPKVGDPERDYVEIPLNFSGSTVDPIFLLIKQRGAKPSPDFAKLTMVGFKVENHGTVVDRAVQAGYKPFREIAVGPAKVSFIADPDGYTLEIF